MMADRTAHRRTREAMVTHEMSGDTAHGGTLEASRGLGGGGGKQHYQRQ